MRDLFGPVVFLCAVLLIAISYFLLHPESGWRQATPAFTAITERSFAKPRKVHRPNPTPMPIEKSRTARPERPSTAPEESVTNLLTRGRPFVQEFTRIVSEEIGNQKRP